MRLRAALAVVLVLAAGACSDDEAPAPRAAAETTAADGRPAWLEDLGAPPGVEEGVTVRGPDGETERVWVDRAERMVYARTCAIARAATEAGGHYGPGNFGPGPGFAFICP